MNGVRRTLNVIHDVCICMYIYVCVYIYWAGLPGNDHADSVWMPTRADLPDCLSTVHDNPSASLPDWSCAHSETRCDYAEGIGDPAQQNTSSLVRVSVSTEAHLISSNQVC